MVGATYDVVLFGVVEVLVEVLVPYVCTLGGFHENERYGGALYLRIAQFVPVNVALIVRDVQSAHFPIGIGYIAVEGFPSELVGTYESVVEEGYVCHYDNAQRDP